MTANVPCGHMCWINRCACLHRNARKATPNLGQMRLSGIGGLRSKAVWSAISLHRSPSISGKGPRLADFGMFLELHISICESFFQRRSLFRKMNQAPFCYKFGYQLRMLTAEPFPYLARKLCKSIRTQARCNSATSIGRTSIHIANKIVTRSFVVAASQVFFENSAFTTNNIFRA